MVIQQLLKRLDSNPLEELARLGRESKHCTVCNRRLESPHSIAQGKWTYLCLTFSSEDGSAVSILICETRINADEPDRRHVPRSVR